MLLLQIRRNFIMRYKLTIDKPLFIPGKVHTFACGMLALLAAFSIAFTNVQIATASSLPTVPASSVAPSPERTVAGEAEGARVTILDSTTTQIVIEMVIDEYAVETLDIEGENYQRVEIPGSGYAEVAGAPQVPLVGAMVGLPTAEGVSVQVLDADYEMLSELKIAPAPSYSATALDLASLDVDSLQPSYVSHPAIYGQDVWYPQAPAQLGMSGLLRDQAVAQVQFLPVQYNPVTQETRLYRRIVAQVTWTEPVSAAQASNRAASPAYEQVLAETLLNYEQLVRPEAEQVVSPMLTTAEIGRAHV